MRAPLPLRLLPAAALAVASSVSCSSTSRPQPAWSGAESWARAALWNDGLAEVATYDARRATYGTERAYEATFVTVKETFTTDLWVKAESEPPPGKSIEVLKQNQIETWRTENYPYNAMTSLFVDRADASRLVKLTMSHQEWCGNTFKEWKGFASPPEMVTHSYWDPEGDETIRFERGTAEAPLLLADQLPLSLRSLPFAAGFERRARLVPSLVSSRTGSPGAVPGTIRVAARETIESGAGRFDCWRVEVAWEGGGAARFHFAAEAPHVLVRYEFPDRSGTLARLRRWAYWDRSKPDPAPRRP